MPPNAPALPHRAIHIDNTESEGRAAAANAAAATYVIIAEWASTAGIGFGDHGSKQKTAKLQEGRPGFI